MIAHPTPGRLYKIVDRWFERHYPDDQENGSFFCESEQGDAGKKRYPIRELHKGDMFMFLRQDKAYMAFWFRGEKIVIGKHYLEWLEEIVL